MYLDLMDVVRMSGNATQKPIDIAPGKVDDIEIVEPVRGVVRAVNARHNIVVDGQAQTTVTMQCARCLSAYPQPLRLQLEAMAPLSFFRALIAGASAAPEPDEDEADDELAALFDANSWTCWSWCGRPSFCNRRSSRCVRPIARACPKRPNT